MTTVVREPLLQPFEECDRLFTVADLEFMPTDLPSGPIDYELDNGRLVFIMVPPGDVHGAVQSNIATELKIQGERKGHGKARTEVGIVLWRNPDRVLGADVVFIANKSLPVRRATEGYLETIPELVVEIRSKNDSLKYVQRNVRDYLKAGVEIVWVPDSTVQTVTVHSAEGEPKVFARERRFTSTRIDPRVFDARCRRVQGVVANLGLHCRGLAREQASRSCYAIS